MMAANCRNTNLFHRGVGNIGFAESGGGDGLFFCSREIFILAGMDLFF